MLHHHAECVDAEGACRGQVSDAAVHHGRMLKKRKLEVVVGETAVGDTVVGETVDEVVSHEGGSRPTSLGEQVIYNKLIRDNILQHFNPYKLSDLQCVLELRCFKGLLSDRDLKEVYFEGIWGFEESSFKLANWCKRGMSLHQVKSIIASAHIGACYSPSIPAVTAWQHAWEIPQIVSAYKMMTYMPQSVISSGLSGAQMVRIGRAHRSLGRALACKRDRITVAATWLSKASGAGLPLTVLEDIITHGFGPGEPGKYLDQAVATYHGFLWARELLPPWRPHACLELLPTPPFHFEEQRFQPDPVVFAEAIEKARRRGHIDVVGYLEKMQDAYTPKSVYAAKALLPHYAL